MSQATTPTLEQTLSIIKPDAVGQNMIGNIIEYFEKEGLCIVAAKMLHLRCALELAPQGNGWAGHRQVFL